MWVIDGETNHNDPLCPQTSPQASHSSPLPHVSLSSHLFTNLFTQKYDPVCLLKFPLSWREKKSVRQQCMIPLDQPGCTEKSDNASHK